MHNYNVLLERTARLAKLINSPGVIHAPLELNHPKSEAGLTLTAFHQILSSVARDRLPRGRVDGGSPGPVPSRQPGCNPAGAGSWNPAGAGSWNPAGAGSWPRVRGCLCGRERGVPLGGCVSGASCSARVHGASELPEQPSGRAGGLEPLVREEETRGSTTRWDEGCA